MRPLNTLRGEAEVAIGGDTYRLAATMEGLASLSGETGCASLAELYQRLIGTELSMSRAALKVFMVGGEDAEGKPLARAPAAARALADLSLTDMDAVREAFAGILMALRRKDDAPAADEPGNAEPAAA
jgi:hypothetical protein